MGAEARATAVVCKELVDLSHKASHAQGDSVIYQLYPVQYKGIFGMPDQGQMLYV